MTDKQIEERALEAYPEDFAWVKCDENSKTYTEIDCNGIKWLKVDKNKTYRDGYIKALKEVETETKTKGWVARDKNKTLWFHYIKPHKENDIEKTWWGSNDKTFEIFDWDFPEFHNVSWESGPVEVELLIRKV